MINDWREIDGLSSITEEGVYAKERMNCLYEGQGEQLPGYEHC